MSSITIPCVCPRPDDGIPRERHPGGDTITLRDKLPFRSVEAIRTEVSLFAMSEPDAGFSDTLAIFAEGYVLHGIESWTLEEDGPKGKPVEISPSRANIRRYILDDFLTADIVSTAADALYAEAVLLPLVTRASNSSPSTPTGKSTSRSRPTSPKRPTPSRRSSISTIPTDATATITSPHDGVSNFSPNSESAA